MNGQTLNRRKKPGFYFRGFTTFALTGAALIIATSGIVLYVTPRGRVANWTQWTLAGLEKEQWAALHMTAAALFLVAVGLHLFFNWKVLLGYLRLKRIPGLRLKRELAAAGVLGGLLVYGTLAGIPPLSDIVELRHELKDYWEQPRARAPLLHAEDLSVDDVASSFEGLGLNKAEPREFYRVLQSKSASRTTETIRGGRGMGRLTLGEYVSQTDLSIETVLEILRGRGIQADPSTPLRQIADSLEMRPGQLSRVLAGETGGAAGKSVGTYCTGREPAIR